MKANPVYLKESRSSLRSPRTIVILMAFNALMTVAGLLSLYLIVEQRRDSGIIYYSEFLQVYVVLAYIEMLILLLLLPAMTAVSISGERERQTLEMMLCTKMKPVTIILGKFQEVMMTILQLLISSMPVLALVFIFGGVGFVDLMYLMMVMFVEGCLIGSGGILCSTLFRKNVLSMVISYLWTLFLCGGTLAISYILSYLPPASSGQMVHVPLYLLLFNPMVTFYVVVNEQAGDRAALFHLFQGMGSRMEQWVVEQWVPMSLMLHLLLAGLFLWYAARTIDPIREHRSREKETIL